MDSSGSVATRTRSRSRLSNGINGATQRNDEDDEIAQFGETPRGKNDILEVNDPDPSPSLAKSKGDDDDVRFIYEHAVHVDSESESLERDGFKYLGNCNETTSSSEIEIERITEDEFRNRKAFSGSKDSSIGTIRKGNYNEATSSDESEIERITEDEFRNRKAFCGADDSSIGRIRKGEFKKPKINHSQEDIKNESTTEAESRKSKRCHPLKDEMIENISEAEFKNTKTHHYPKGIVSEQSSKAEFRNSNERMSKSVFRNNAIEIEVISEAEFRNKHHSSNEFSSGEGFSGRRAEKDPRYEQQTAESDKHRNEESAFAHTGKMGRSGSGYDDSSFVSIRSISNSQLEGKDGMRSHGLCNESNLGIASRTRLKIGYGKKPLKVENISSDTLDGSLSSSDSGSSDSLSSNETDFDYTDDDEDSNMDKPGFSDSNQACLPKDLSEDKNIDRLKVNDFSSIGTKRLKKVVSSMDKCGLKTRNEESDKTSFDLHDHASRKNHTENQEAIQKLEEIEQPIRRKRAYLQKENHLCQNMCDVVLGIKEGFEPEENNEVKKSTISESALPLKFRFEDEVPKPVEKSEYDIEMEGLFAEMAYCYTMHSSESKKVEEDDADCSDAEDNQYVRCLKGKHHLFMDDEIGLKCLYCIHVELESKHVLPAWAERRYRGRDRSRSFGSEQQSCGIGLNFTSGDNLTGLCNNGKGTVWDIKPTIRNTMYEHQQEGFEFLWKNLAGSTDLSELKTSDSSDVGGCIISHAPGTGKTRLTIVFIETYLKLFPNSRPVIIAPASMLLTWEEEFKKWEVEFPLHNLSNPEISGKEDKMAIQCLLKGKRQYQNAVRMVKFFSWNKEQSILCMSYTLFEQLVGERGENDKGSKKRKRVAIEKESSSFRRILLEKPGLIILDEGHTPRNRRSNIWNALFRLQTKKRIILSGTPFQNNFDELFNLLRLVRPTVAEVLVKERRFAEMTTAKGMQLRKKYRDDREDQSASEAETLNNAIEELKKAMAPFVHVHKGTILQQSLPGLRDCVILLNPPALQKSLIKRIKGSQNTFKLDHEVALISVHPYLLRHCSSTEKEEFAIDESALEASELNPNEGVKTRFLVELVRLSIARNEKVLVFSQYIQPLLLINVQLRRTFNWADGKQLFMMQGRMEQKQRQCLINAFNNPKNEAMVLLASTKCCSEGINLVGASRVVLLDVVWNPSVERQAISRAYRLGQKKIVYTYHLMTSGTTEGDKYCRQAEKERLSELVFASTSNEKCKESTDIGIEDEVLEDMVANVNLKDMFDKIVCQPKEKNLIETFGLPS